MKNGICPKCAGAAVYAIIPTGQDGTVTIGMLKYLVPTLHICQNCGYSETYFLSKADRDKLPERGRHVTPAS